MKPSLKPFLMIEAVSRTAGNTAGTGMIDTYDSTNGVKYNFLQLVLKEATADVVSNKPTVLKLTESDTTNLTDATAITDFTGGTSVTSTTGFVIANANTSATSQTVFNVDLKGRKRYIFLNYVPALTQINSAYGFLGNAAEMPYTATRMGVKQLIES